MSIETIVKCDICGAIKGATNHWFLVNFVHGDSRTIQHIQIFSFEISFPNGKVIVCGESCMHKLISQNLPTFFGIKTEPQGELTKLSGYDGRKDFQK